MPLTQADSDYFKTIKDLGNDFLLAVYGLDLSYDPLTYSGPPLTRVTNQTTIETALSTFINTQHSDWQLVKTELLSTGLDIAVFKTTDSSKFMIFSLGNDLEGTSAGYTDVRYSGTPFASDIVPVTVFELEKIYKDIAESNPTAEITLSGHSIGGTVALATGALLQSESALYHDTVKVVAYNPIDPGTLLNNLGISPAQLKEENIVTFHNSLDMRTMIYGWNTFGEVYFTQPTAIATSPSVDNALTAFSSYDAFKRLFEAIGTGNPIFSDLINYEHLLSNIDLDHYKSTPYLSTPNQQAFYSKVITSAFQATQKLISQENIPLFLSTSQIVSGGTGNDILIGHDNFDGINFDFYRGTQLQSNDEINGGGGDDILFGDKGNDTLTGGDGNDTLYGSLGNDTFVFNKGDDADTLLLSFGDNDTLQFKGFNRNEVSLESVENSQYSTKDLVITRTDTPTDKVTVVNQFLRDTNQPHLGIEHLVFDDGEIILGNLQIDIKNGTSQADYIVTFDGNDQITGGGGNDTLYGGTGFDIYNYPDNNFGDDVIVESGIATETNVLNFGTSISYDDLTFTDSGTDKIITIAGQTGSITIKNWADNRFAFITSSGITGSDLSETYIGQAGNDTYHAGGGNDTAYGDNIQSKQMIGGNDSLNGGTGNDLLLGEGKMAYGVTDLNHFVSQFQAGNDTLVGGDGDDSLYGDGVDFDITILSGNGEVNSAQMTGHFGNDYLDGGAGNDYLLAEYGLTGIVSSGILSTDFSQVQAGNNTLVGGTGDDTLVGGKGNDQYVFHSGDGDDLIDESSSINEGGGFDQIVFGTGIEKADLTFTDDGNDKLISYGDSSIRITNQLNERVIDEIRFNDGSSLDYYEFRDDIQLNEHASILSGEVLAGGTGVDYLHGNVGADTLNAGDGDDILDGGEGNDTLTGGNGNDVYVFKDENWGNDTISDTSGNDTLDFSTLATGTTISLGTALSGSVHVSSGSNTVSWSSVNIENALGGQGNDVITGSSSNNLLVGNEGNDTLNGAGGNDTLNGGTGNDTYVLSGAGNTVQINDSSGDDTYVLSSAWGTAHIADSSGINTIDLTSQTSNLDIDFTSSSNPQISNGTDTVQVTNGNVFSLLLGNGNDEVKTSYNLQSATIDGGAGNDTITSSAASDTLIGGSGNDVLTASGGGGVLQGGTDNDTLIGSWGNDILDGGSGVDSMQGYYGDDTYVVDSTSDVVDELQDEFGGTDTIQASISYTLGSYLENLTLTGSSNLNGTGNSLDNNLQGNSSNNSLTGGAGNDTLDGGAGADTLVGGSGDDLYSVDSTSDVVTELADEGLDTVQASVSYTLGTNVENLALTGTGNLSGTGNSLDNLLLGNSGNNTLDGGTGADTLMGGADNDTYIVDSIDDIVLEAANEGTDSVQSSVTYFLGDNVENLTLTGSADIDGFGNELDNVITGNSGNNLLFGFGGADTLNGGAGDDTYFVDSTDVVVNENAAAGNDTVTAAISYTLGNNLENLTLIGTDAVNGTGNALDNTLIGNEGDNQLTGNDGTDTLDGGSGNDTLTGGTGNDVYIVNQGTVTIVEALSEGTDTIQLGYDSGDVSYQANGDDLEIVVDSTVIATITNQLGVSGYRVESFEFADSTTLTAAEVAGLLGGSPDPDQTLTGSSGSDTLVGGSGNDSISGLAGTDSLVGAAGNDTLLGGDGNDTLNGGLGNDSLNGEVGDDTYVFTPGWGTDIVYDSFGNNIADLSAITTNLTVNLTSGSTQLTDGANSADISNGYIRHVIAGSGNDTLTGSTSSDTLVGGDGNDSLVGNFGTDSLVGGNGNDTLIGGSSNDVLDGGAGDDLYVFAEGWGADTILADASGNDTLDLSGVVSNVTADLDSTGTEVTTSYDSINWSGTFIENIITGWGNDTLVGNSQANLLNGGAGTDSLSGEAGDDTLIGGFGNDSLNGGDGNDTYVFVSAWGADTITGDSGGVDTIDLSNGSMGLTVDLDTTGTEVTDGGGYNTLNWSGTFIENVIAGGGWDSVTGNASDNYLSGKAGNDTLIGEAGNDTLSGDGGNDTLNGGAGNDTYLFAQGDGQDVISDSGDSDTILFDSSVSLSNVVFFQTGTGNLQIGYTNSSGDLITVQGQSTASTAVERFELSNGQYMSDADVNQILSDMASYAATNSISLTSLDDVKNDANLVAIVNGGWHN